MISYAYVAVEPSGKKKTGIVEAADQTAAMAMITADGRFVLEIREERLRADQAAAQRASKRGKISRSDLALFSRRMADLAEAGLPLDRVLQVVAEQSESRHLAAIAEEALADVRTGIPVSQALAKHPKYFPDVYTQTLKAGEASGQFPEVAGRLADFQEKEVARRSQIVSAMIYPSILAATAVFVVLFLLLFVVPRLSGVFADLGDKLPTTTKMLLAFTGFLNQNGLYLLGGLVGLYILYRGWAATEAGALQRDAWFLRMPIAGPIIRKAVVSRFSRVLGTLVFGGVPILEALRLSGLASGNRLFMRKSEEVENEVREGHSIAEAMRDAGAFPPVLTHMVAIGEETGDLPKMLSRVSDSLDFEVDNGMRRLTSMVEPVIVLSMGVIVGFVVLAVLLPITEAQSLVK